MTAPVKLLQRWLDNRNCDLLDLLKSVPPGTQIDTLELLLHEAAMIAQSDPILICNEIKILNMLCGEVLNSSAPAEDRCKWLNKIIIYRTKLEECYIMRRMGNAADVGVCDCDSDARLQELARQCEDRQPKKYFRVAK